MGSSSIWHILSLTGLPCCSLNNYGPSRWQYVILSIAPTICRSCVLPSDHILQEYSLFVAVSILYKLEMLLSNCYLPGCVLDSEGTKIIKQAEFKPLTVKWGGLTLSACRDITKLSATYFFLHGSQEEICKDNSISPILPLMSQIILSSIYVILCGFYPSFLKMSFPFTVLLL